MKRDANGQQAPSGGPEGGRRPTEGPPDEAPLAGPLQPGQRWSVARKREVVLRLLRGESLEGLSRQFAIESYRLERWREQALSGMDLALKERTGDPLQGELDQAMRRIGELSMENELLWQRVRSKPGPLAKRRSSK